MNKYIDDFVAKCIICQQVKLEYQKLLECYNLYRLLSENGIMLQWILLMDFHAPYKVLMLFL